MEGSIWKKDKNFCRFMKKITKYLLRLYYEKYVSKVRIEKLNYKDLKKFILFVKKLKKDPKGSKLLGLDKVSAENWGVNGVTSNEFKEGIFLVAKFNEKIIGFCNLFRKGKHYEVGIALLKEYRNKGIGTELIKNLVSEARKLGIKEIFAGVKKENSKAIEFFKFNGFEVLEEKERSLLLRRCI
jgi:ribosomal protein S18 acetylase RimI-like enzyme